MKNTDRGCSTCNHKKTSGRIVESFEEFTQNRNLNEGGVIKHILTGEPVDYSRRMGPYTWQFSKRKTILGRLMYGIREEYESIWRKGPFIRNDHWESKQITNKYPLFESDEDIFTEVVDFMRTFLEDGGIDTNIPNQLTLTFKGGVVASVDFIKNELVIVQDGEVSDLIEQFLEALGIEGIIDVVSVIVGKPINEGFFSDTAERVKRIYKANKNFNKESPENLKLGSGKRRLSSDEIENIVYEITKNLNVNLTSSGRRIAAMNGVERSCRFGDWWFYLTDESKLRLGTEDGYGSALKYGSDFSVAHDIVDTFLEGVVDPEGMSKIIKKVCLFAGYDRNQAGCLGGPGQ
jgi:hypothetical protein